MKELAWVGVFVTTGIIVGAFAFARTPARYRAITSLQVTTTLDPRYDKVGRRYALPWQTQDEASDERFAEMMHRGFSEDWTEHLMQELGLYREQRRAGHWADALLDFRRSTTFSRRVESQISERWLVAFEADDPRVAETVSSRMAAVLVDSFDGSESDRVERYGGVGPALTFLRERLWEVEARMSRWTKTHPGVTPPPTLLKEYKWLSDTYDELLRREVPVPIGDRDGPQTRFSVRDVKTPRMSDGQVGPRLLPFVGTGAMAGLVLGLFTMPPFFWWRRHAP